MNTPKYSCYWLGAIQTLVAIGALGAGYAMITDPSGDSLGLPTSLLSDSPFESYMIPGVVLFAVHGLFRGGASITAFLKKKYSGLLGVITGLLMIGWLIFQIYWIGFFPVMQLLYMGFGVLELSLGYMILNKIYFQNE